MDTHKTVADMAASKFTNMLNRFYNLVTTIFPVKTCSTSQKCWLCVSSENFLFCLRARMGRWLLTTSRTSSRTESWCAVSKTPQDLRILPSVTLYSQGTIIGMNWGSQLPEVNNCQICQQFFSFSFCWSDHVSSSLCFKTSLPLTKWVRSEWHCHLLQYWSASRLWQMIVNILLALLGTCTRSDSGMDRIQQIMWKSP